MICRCGSALAFDPWVVGVSRHDNRLAVGPRARSLPRALAPAVLVTATQPGGSPADTTASRSVTPSASRTVSAVVMSPEAIHELTDPLTVWVLRSPILPTAGKGLPSTRKRTTAVMSSAVDRRAAVQPDTTVTVPCDQLAAALPDTFGALSAV